jgi:hypothetical protein
MRVTTVSSGEPRGPFRRDRRLGISRSAWPWRPAVRGTEGSNRPSSSGESANFWFLSGGALALASLRQQNWVPSVHIRCRMTARRRAKATIGGEVPAAAWWSAIAA